MINNLSTNNELFEDLKSHLMDHYDDNSNKKPSPISYQSI